MTLELKAVLGFALGLLAGQIWTGVASRRDFHRRHHSHGRPWRGHGRLRFGTPTKRKDENMLFRFEIDEEVDVGLPAIVDDDGDPLNVESVDWSTSDENVAVFVPAPDGLSATLKSRGVVGQISITAKVKTPDGGVGTYTGEVSLGLGVPVGGELTFGTPRKLTPQE